MLMVENQHTRLIWKTFMKNAEARTAMQLVGLQPGWFFAVVKGTLISGDRT